MDWISTLTLSLAFLILTVKGWLMDRETAELERRLASLEEELETIRRRESGLPEKATAKLVCDAYGRDTIREHSHVAHTLGFATYVNAYRQAYARWLLKVNR